MIDVGDWKRDGDCHNQWNRRGADGNNVYVNDNAERGVFRALVCGTLLGSTFACPDAAREAADAHLVSQGRLDKSRAFRRVGDWEDVLSGSFRTSRQYAIRARNTPDRITGKAWEVFAVPGIRPVLSADGPETGDAGKAAADAELVRRGLLAEERAFKVAAFPCVPIPASALVTGAVHLHTGSITVECEKVIPFVVHTARRGGDYEYSLSDGSVACIAVKPGDHLRYTVTNGRGTFAHRGTRAAGHPSAPVTLATWEHHLPTLLDNAPREFRDGFNRRQGPAWDAYLRALAWVKEQIQCKRVGLPNVREAITMAALTAQGNLGAEWVKANVREPFPKWEAVSALRMGNR